MFGIPIIDGGEDVKTVLNFYHIGKQIPENAVYIGRGNSKLNLPNSKFANPFPITKTANIETVIKQYQRWLWEEIKAKRITIEDLLAISGKDLVCYCAPKACHGHVIEKAIVWAHALVKAVLAKR